MKTAILAFLILAALTAHFVYGIESVEQNQQDIGGEALSTFKNLISRLDEIFKAFDNWLLEKIGFNISKAVKLLGNIIIWIIQLVIKLAKWAVESIV